MSASQPKTRKSKTKSTGLRLEDERHSYGSCIGVDEVGVGCSAGNLIVCAVYLTNDFHDDENKMIKDSKKFSATQRMKREATAQFYRNHAHVKHALVEFEPTQIDEWNPRQCRLKGFTESVMKVLDQMTHEQQSELKSILIDGDLLPSDLFPILHARNLSHIQIYAMVKGDATSYSIAMASMIAKTVRDDQMKALHALYPEYGFDKHNGYCHVTHKLSVMKYGLTPFHRLKYNMNLTEKEKQRLQSSKAVFEGTLT